MEIHHRKNLTIPVMLICLMLLSILPLGLIGTVSANRNMYLHGHMFVVDSEHGKVFGIDLVSALENSASDEGVVSEAYLLKDGGSRIDATPLGIAHDKHDLYVSFDDGSIHHWTQEMRMSSMGEIGTGHWVWQSQATLPEREILSQSRAAPGGGEPQTFQPYAVSLDIYDASRVIYTDGLTSNVYAIDRITLQPTGLQGIWDDNLNTVSVEDHVVFSRGDEFDQVNHRFNGVSTHGIHELDSHGDEITRSAIYGMSNSLGSLSRMDFIPSIRSDGWQYDAEAPVKVNDNSISIDAIDTINNTWNSSSEEGYSWYNGASTKDGAPQPVHFIRTGDTIRLFREEVNFRLMEFDASSPFGFGTSIPPESQPQVVVQGFTENPSNRQISETEFVFSGVSSSAQYPIWSTLADGVPFTYGLDETTEGGSMVLKMGNSEEETITNSDISNNELIRWDAAVDPLLPHEPIPVPSRVRFDYVTSFPKYQDLQGTVGLASPSRVIDTTFAKPTTESSLFAISDESEALWLNGVAYVQVYEIALPSWSSEFADISVYIPQFEIPEKWSNIVDPEPGNLEITSVRPVQSVFDTDLVIGKRTVFEVTYDYTPPTWMGVTMELAQPITIEINLNGFFTCRQIANFEVVTNPNAECYDGILRQEVSPRIGTNVEILPNDKGGHPVPIDTSDEKFQVNTNSGEYNLNIRSYTATYTVTIDADHILSETDEVDNEYVIQSMVTKRGDRIDYALLPIILNANDGTVVGPPPDASLQLLADEFSQIIQGMYPLGAEGDGFSITILNAEEVDEKRTALLTKRAIHKAAKDHLDEFDKVVAYVDGDDDPNWPHEDLFFEDYFGSEWGEGGYAFCPPLAPISVIEINRDVWTLAHEAGGHLFDLPHDHNTARQRGSNTEIGGCHESRNDASEDIDGYDILEIHPSKPFDTFHYVYSCSDDVDTPFVDESETCQRSVMRYWSDSDGSIDSRDTDGDGSLDATEVLEAEWALNTQGHLDWLTKSDYEWILNEHDIDPELIFVSGHLNSDGTAEISTVRHKPFGFLTLHNESEGLYNFILLDKDENVLREVGFNSSFSGDAHSDVDSDIAHFAHRIAWIDGIRTIKLTDDSGNVLSSFSLSANEPQMEHLSISDPDSSGMTLIEWAASDLDGDSLTFEIQVKEMKKAWKPVARGLTGTSYSIDLGAHASGSDVNIRVVANDGAHTAIADFDGIVKIPSFTISIDSESLTPIDSLGSKFFAMTLKRHAGFTDTVNLSLVEELEGFDVTWLNGSSIEYDGTEEQRILVRFQRNMNADAGLHRIRIMADSGENIQIERISLHIHNGAPITFFSNHDDGDSVACESGNCPEMILLAHDPSGINNVVFKLNGVPVDNIQSAPYNIQLNDVDFSEGNQTLTAITYDYQGHWSLISLNLYLVDIGEGEPIGSENNDGTGLTESETENSESENLGPFATESWVLMFVGLFVGLVITQAFRREST